MFKHHPSVLVAVVPLVALSLIVVAGCGGGGGGGGSSSTPTTTETPFPTPTPTPTPTADPTPSPNPTATPIAETNPTYLEGTLGGVPVRYINGPSLPTYVIVTREPTAPTNTFRLDANADDSAGSTSIIFNNIPFQVGTYTFSPGGNSSVLPWAENQAHTEAEDVETTVTGSHGSITIQSISPTTYQGDSVYDVQGSFDFTGFNYLGRSRQATGTFRFLISR